MTRGRRDKLMLLASERNAQDYSKLAPSVDGNAYYWSSVNPDTFPGYVAKLREMGRAVHRRKGIWIAPAAPGFSPGGQSPRGPPSETGRSVGRGSRPPAGSRRSRGGPCNTN